VVRGVGQSGGIARWRRAEAPGTRRRDWHRSEVACDLQHHRLSTPQREVNSPVDQGRGVGRVPHREGSGCDLCIDLPLIVVSHLAQGVVDDLVLPLRVAVDPAHNDDDGQILGVRARHGVEGAQPANAVGDDHCRDTIRTRVSVGGVTSVQLVAATDHPQARILEDLVEEDEVEVAGHDEIIADPDLLQPG